jgi:hypothetical protein
MQENQHLASLLNKDLGIDEESMMIPVSGIDSSMIREKLALVISHLLQNNFERLLQAMYRLDVSESKFHRVLHEEDPQQIPFALADLVIEREMQKVKTRIMYKRKEL